MGRLKTLSTLLTANVPQVIEIANAMPTMTPVQQQAAQLYQNVLSANASLNKKNATQFNAIYSDPNTSPELKAAMEPYVQKVADAYGLSKGAQGAEKDSMEKGAVQLATVLAGTVMAGPGASAQTAGSASSGGFSPGAYDMGLGAPPPGFTAAPGFNPAQYSGLGSASGLAAPLAQTVAQTVAPLTQQQAAQQAATKGTSELATKAATTAGTGGIVGAVSDYINPHGVTVGEKYLDGPGNPLSTVLGGGSGGTNIPGTGISVGGSSGGGGLDMGAIQKLAALGIGGSMIADLFKGKEGTPAAAPASPGTDFTSLMAQLNTANTLNNDKANKAQLDELQASLYRRGLYDSGARDTLTQNLMGEQAKQREIATASNALNVAREGESQRQYNQSYALQDQLRADAVSQANQEARSNLMGAILGSVLQPTPYTNTSTNVNVGGTSVGTTAQPTQTVAQQVANQILGGAKDVGTSVGGGGGTTTGGNTTPTDLDTGGTSKVPPQPTYGPQTEAEFYGQTSSMRPNSGIMADPNEKTYATAAEMNAARGVFPTTQTYTNPVTQSIEAAAFGPALGTAANPNPGRQSNAQMAATATIPNMAAPLTQTAPATPLSTPALAGGTTSNSPAGWNATDWDDADVDAYENAAVNRAIERRKQSSVTNYIGTPTTQINTGRSAFGGPVRF